MRRRAKNRPLSVVEQKRNHKFSLRRRPVEKLFGTPKRSYRLGHVPYFNQARNTVILIMARFAYNMRRCHAVGAP